MAEQIYVELRDAISETGGGFPVTENGSEFAILEHRFTKEDAEYAVRFRGTKGYMSGDEYAEMAGLDKETVNKKLYDMSVKGLIFRKKFDGLNKYRLAPLIHGIWEYTVDDMEPEWLEQMIEAFGTGTNFNYFVPGNETPFMRTVPVGKDVTVDNKLLKNDDLEIMCKNASNIRVWDCACRKKSEVLGNPNEHTDDLRTCIVLNDMADFYEENGWGDKLTAEEALKLIDDGADKGRIAQVVNTSADDATCICSCNIEDCFTVMGRKLVPDLDNFNDYTLEIDESKCVGVCSELCTSKCQIEVLTSTDDKLSVDNTRCMGCGLCVRECPHGAIKLVQKSEYIPPEGMYDLWDGMQEVIQKAYHSDNNDAQEKLKFNK